MSKFTTKKLPSSTTKKTQPISTVENITPNSKKKVRYTIAICLVILGAIFGVNYAVQSIGNIQVGTAWDNPVWKPPIFESSWSTTPQKKWITNILIAGIGGEWHQAGSLTDSIMLASLDEEKNTVTMISIPRDLYVSYGDNNGAGKINTLYPIGLSKKEGILPLANKVSEITGQSIHHYMVIDFTAFRYIVNALWGIEIDVKKDLYDNEYPDYNYGYTIFSVKKWLQNFDGETALRYARSRHSTSDMDRSSRQQQIISAIKTKSLSAGVITSPTKISNIIEATRSNINTDLTISDIVNLWSTFASIEKSNIHVYNLGNDCSNYINCNIGAYLYNPSMAYFGWAWSLIPEWARINRLSYYDRIRGFVNFVFHFPGINTVPQPIVVVHNKTTINYAKNLLMEMRKIGINFDANNALSSSTGEIERSHINIYWNSEFEIGINPESEIAQALKMLDIRIPVNIVQKNEFVTTSGPKIEIVLGKDYKDYFSFAKPTEYLPKIEMPASSGTTISGEKNEKKPIIPTKSTTPTKTNNATEHTNNSPYKVSPGEWEEL